jgi:uncharacterized protein (TIGR03437 family)
MHWVPATRRVSVLLALLFVSLGATVSSAAPVIFQRGVVNAASFAPPGVPWGAIAQGSIFTVFGRDIGPTTAGQVSAFPLETNFQGVEVLVIQGSTTVNAIPIFVFNTQLNVIMPSNAPLGDVVIRVRFNGETSNAMPVRTVKSAVGLFTATGAGMGPVILQNFNSQADQPINSTQKTAKPKQFGTLWATGLGPISGPDNEAPPVGTLPHPVEIYVGDKMVSNIAYSGRTPCCAGVDQFVFELPEDVTEGCYVPLRVVVDGVAVSNTATMAIQKDGEPCSEPDNPFLEPFLSGGSHGLLALLKTSVKADVGVITPTEYSFEQSFRYFARKTAGEFAFDPWYALPPAGSCTSYVTSGDVLMLARNPFRGTTALLAGGISLTGANGTVPLGAVATTALSTVFSKVLVGGPKGLLPIPDRPDFLDPGSYQISGQAGDDVPAFSATADVGGEVSWANRDAFTTIDRDAGVEFRWTGAAEARVWLAGVNVDIPSNSSSLFLCAAPPGTSAMTVPPEILANFRASRSILGRSTGYLVLAAVPSGAVEPFAVDGLEFAASVYRTLDYKTVRFE